MSPQSAKKLTLVSVALMGGTVVVKDLTGKQQTTFARLWAVGALGVVLSVVADFAPQVAGPLAALIAISYLAGADTAITTLVHGATGSAGAANLKGATSVAPRQTKAGGPQ